MELTQIIKTLRDIKILLNHFNEYPEIQRKIQNNNLNIIDLD